MRRRLPGETWKDWRRRNEPDLTMLALAAVIVAIVIVLGFIPQ